MEKHIKSIYTPRFIGERFKGHRLPLEFLDDLQVLGSINSAIAKWLWKNDNHGRKRVPKGFEKGISYAVTEIKDGSAIPNVELIAPMSGFFPGRYTNYFEDAPTKLKEAIQVLDEGGDPTEILPKSILLMMESFGSSLRSDEIVEFRPNQEKAARFTVQTRKKLILQVSKDRQYSTEGVMRGVLSELDKRKRSFHIQLINGKAINGVYPNELKEDMLDAFNEDQNDAMKRIAIHGSILFNAEDLPVSIQKVTEVENLDSMDVAWRLEEISLIKEGWYEGKGLAFAKNELERLAEQFDKNFVIDILPHLYPTPDGKISAEWENETHDISLEVEPKTLKSNLHLINFATDKSDEIEFDLSNERDWKKLNDFLKDKLQG